MGGAARSEDDHLLVVRAQAGDAAAFAALYDRHVDAVRRVVGDQVRSADERADVVQEAFARALARIARLREPDRFRSWLFAIARNAAIDHRRARGRARLDPVDEDESPQLLEPGAGPEERTDAGEALAVVRRCIEGLSERDRTALGLVAHLGFRPVEVGAVLGVSQGAAKVVVSRARARLRDAVVDLVIRGSRCGALPGSPQAGAPTRPEHVRTCLECNQHLHDALAPVLASVLVGA